MFEKGLQLSNHQLPKVDAVSISQHLPMPKPSDHHGDVMVKHATGNVQRRALPHVPPTRNEQVAS